MSYDGVRTTLNKDISHPLRFSHFCRLPVGRYEIQQDSKDAPVVLIGCPFSKKSILRNAQTERKQKG